MYIHIQTHIEHRQIDGKYTTAHLFLKVTKVKFVTLTTRYNSVNLPIEFYIVNLFEIYDQFDIDMINKFLGKELFTNDRMLGVISLTTQSVWPEFLNELPAQMPRNYETNPEMEVKILVSE